jgi:hypothetical protein
MDLEPGKPKERLTAVGRSDLPETNQPNSIAGKH